MKKIWGVGGMLIATVLWGVAFSAQSRGMAYVDPMLFVMLRSRTGVAALFLVIAGVDLYRKRGFTFRIWKGDPGAERVLLSGGSVCGIILAAASILQQYGLKYISAGKSGFLTALYIVIVPVLGLFLNRRTNPVLWLAVMLAMSGSYLLCGGVDQVGAGEYFVIGCAFVYSLHILAVDHYAAKCDCIRLSCIQFSVVTLFSALASLLMGDSWQLNKILDSLPFWIFCGVGSSAIAFTLQIAAQKYLHPVTASLLMSLESVFAVLGGWLFLQERLSARELAGCGIIFLGVILAQLPVAEREKKISGCEQESC